MDWVFLTRSMKATYKVSKLSKLFQVYRSLKEVLPNSYEPCAIVIHEGPKLPINTTKNNSKKT